MSDYLPRDRSRQTPAAPHTAGVVLLLLIIAILASSCASAPSAPENVELKFSLPDDLLGKTVGNGNFSAIDGTSRDFTVHIDGSRDGRVMTLVEDFEYADGVRERKTWTLTQQANGEYSGVREDVVGTARGYQDGKVFRLEYTMAIPNADGTPGRKVNFRDVLYKQADGTIRNDAVVGILGFRVARVKLILSPAE